MDWEKIKLGSWSAVGGAIGLAIVGFNWGGWVTGGAAEAMAKQRAAVLASIGELERAQDELLDKLVMESRSR